MHLASFLSETMNLGHSNTWAQNKKGKVSKIKPSVW